MPQVQVDPSQLALQRLYHWEKTAPDRVAMTQPMGGGAITELTWKQLMDQSRRMAAHLQAQGIGPGDKVAMISKNTAWWMITDFAIWMAGGVSVPLYPTLAADTIRQILEHSESKLLFIGKLDGWAGMKSGVPKGMHCIAMPLAPAKGELPQGTEQWDKIIAGSKPLAGNPVRNSDDLATIMYTSGTTGTPKGVMHNFGGFAWAVQTALPRVGMNADSRMLSYLPLSHVVERALVEHGQLATGMSVYFAESLDTFTADLQRARPTIFFSVPRLWVKFQQGISAKMPPAKLNLLLKIPVLSGIVKKKVLSALGLQECHFAAGGAAPMPRELLLWYSKLGLNIAEGYGMTENIAASHLSSGDPADFGTVGMAYDGVQCRLAPTSSEILVTSPATMIGYYKEPELTKQTFTEDGWLRTGDKGALDARGNLKITGRVKDLFKTSKGKYVAPAPIEDKLVMHNAVEACCVTGANLGQPLAVLMLNETAVAQSRSAEGRTELETSLAAHLSQINATLDPHEHLACLVLVTEPWSVDNGFITPTFKVKRNRVEEVYAASYEKWENARKPVIWL